MRENSPGEPSGALGSEPGDEGQAVSERTVVAGLKWHAFDGKRGDTLGHCAPQM